jgi:hypothetical protein
MNTNINNTNNISNQIQSLFDQNRLNDLQKFLTRRRSLNTFNAFLTYFFYLVQSIGIMITMIGSSYGNPTYIWVGVGFNIGASLINVYEKINNNILKKMLTNIQLIKDNNYVDESIISDMENIGLPVSTNTVTQQQQPINPNQSIVHITVPGSQPQQSQVTTTH